MTDVEIRASGLSRRSFLKGSLAASALAAGGSAYLTGCAPKNVADNAEEMAETGTPVEVNEEIYSGVCRCNCYGGCHLNVHVRDGKIVRTSARELPEKAWTRICAKGLSHVYRVYDPNRAKYPMRRVGERGSGEWEQISWDEALSEMAEKFTQYAEEFGPESIGFCGGAGNDAFLNNMGRFQNAIGASTVATPLDMAPFFSMNQVVGLSMNFHGNEMTDLKNAKTIVIWGSNPAVSQIQGMHFISEAHEAGAKLICIDPVYTATASKCDQWIPIAPGTDGLLAIALMNIILEKGWEDAEFIKSSTVAPFLVKASDGAYLRLSDLGRAEAGSEADAIVVTDGAGTFDVPEAIADPVVTGAFDVNGEKVTCAWDLLIERISGYSVDEACRLTDISREVMEGLAEDIAVNKPASMYILLGIDHYQNGFYSIFDMGCITALTGNIGKPGAFCGISEGVYYMYGYQNPNAQLGSMFEGAQPSAVSVPVFAMQEALDSGTWLGNPYTLKALWICKRNVLGNLCDRQSMLKWMEQVPFIVVSEVTMNEQARYADLFLPVCHWFEYEDVGATYPQNVFVEYSEKVIDPLYESKSDFDIVKELAGKMGLADKFDFTPADYLREYFDSEACNALGLTYDNLVEKKAVRALPGSEEHPFIHGEDGIPTETGRVQFYVEPANRAPSMALESTPDLSRFGLPYWEAPGEVVVGGTGDEKYPYQVLSDHQRLRTHSQWINVPPMRELDPEPTVKLHPETAEAHGIAEGDYVRILNDHGQVVVKGHLSEGVRPGILLCSRGWEDADFVEGHLQDVLSDEVSDICVTQAFFDTAATIEKAEV